MRIFKRLVPLALGLALAVPLSAVAEERSIIVLDGSGSMWGQIGGRAKLEIAREALGKVVAGIPAETEIGLMAYGHRSTGQCDDIELVVPPAKGTGAAITSAAGALKFQGKTPLTEAVRQAALSLKYTEDKATVILITDGVETCNADPCALGTELEQSGVDFTAHVVGFGLSEAEGKAVACLATNTGGQYIEARDAGSLELALQQAVAAPPPPPPAPAPPAEPAKLAKNIDPKVLLLEGGSEGDFERLAVFRFYAPVAPGAVRGAVLLTIYGEQRDFLPAGRYEMVTELGVAVVQQEVEITETALAEPVAVMNAGRIELTASGTAGAEPDTGIAIRINGPNQVSYTDYGKVGVYIPAGEYGVNLERGTAKASQSLVVQAGQITKADYVLDLGQLVVRGTYDGAQELPERDVRYEILEAKKNLSGARKSVMTEYRPGHVFKLPPGDYVARVQYGQAVGEAPVRVEAGGQAEVSVSVNAGVVAISAPGAARVYVLRGADRERLASEYKPGLQVALPAGSYIAQSWHGDKPSAEQSFEMPVGERVEITLAP